MGATNHGCAKDAPVLVDAVGTRLVESTVIQPPSSNTILGL